LIDQPSGGFPFLSQVNSEGLIVQELGKANVASYSAVFNDRLIDDNRNLI
jgi:hypothetical protein